MSLNTMNLLTRIGENQDRAKQLKEDLERSANAQKVMPHLFAKGKFSMTVTGRQTPGSRFLGLRNLPYKASIKYAKSGVVVELSYQEWSVLSKTYYSPEQHSAIERYWNSEGT